MHSSELVPPPPPPATGPALLMKLGKLIVRSRSASPSQDARMQAKLLVAKPSTSQIQTQPKLEYQEPQSGEDCQLDSHVQTLWEDQLPVSIEVLLAPSCQSCQASLRHPDADFQLNNQKAFLLERWTMKTLGKCDSGYITSQWLLNAVRSQLHFSQLSAWLATLQEPTERRRKLSRETCNIKKLESNCDENDLPSDKNKLNIVYSIKISNESKQADFSRTPNTHNFPITSIGSDVYLKVVLETLPRIDEIPTVKCACKRRNSKEIPAGTHEELIGILNDLSIGNKFQSDLNAINSNIGTSNRRLSIVSNTGSTEYLYTSTPDKDKVVDDRMYMNCSENGKHKCSCDDESDGNKSSKIKLDERRLKEIAKYKRRLRKENKMKKQSDSTSSEGDGLRKETHTSIPILQAARFDRFRAIGCYRNQTYLTLPASRIEGKSPFVDSETLPPQEYKKTNSVSTQTDDISCYCGTPLQDKCEDCVKGMVRSEGTYNLASLNPSEVLLEAIKRCRDDDAQVVGNKKLKCDNFSNKTCDINSFSIIRRPKMKRYDRISSIVNDRAKCDIEELHLKADDSVFSVKPEAKRQKTFSISDDDYVAYEKCDYGTFDQCGDDGFKFPDPKKLGEVPSPTEMDRFRWTFDSAASMVFHAKTGLPLTSSPAPLRRGNNCFDFDDSINGISGIKSALFHPVSPSEAAPAPPPPRREKKNRLKLQPSTGLLGSFEESALKGRLEAVATVHGFTAELGASGAFCPPHKKLPVTVFFYAPGGTNAPYMGHINLGSGGYRVSRSGTIQVSLFNPHGTLVKMFVVLYDLTSMPACARTFLRQRTLYLPAGANAPPPSQLYKYMRYLIHLRFMTSKSGKLYLHTDIRIIVSRKSDLDTATAHSSIFRPIPTNQSETNGHNQSAKSHNDSANDNNGYADNHNASAIDHNGTAIDRNGSANESNGSAIDHNGSANNHNDSANNHDDSNDSQKAVSRSPNRVFGGCSEFHTELKNGFKEIGYDAHNGAVSYELRSFTYAPDNPKYSPR